uniref:ANK_REP_REGION domain-containing protein n=1 Tax=Syphacia muris TaxID=451379 RepID=A0A0N5AQ99_9BILA
MNASFAYLIQQLIHGDFNSFERHIKQHPDLLNIRTRRHSLLTFAVLNDRLRAVHFLNKHVEKGLSFSEGDENGVTAVHWAVIADAEKCLKYILKIPHNPEWMLLKDSHGITPVHLAAKLGKTKFLKMLLEAVVDVERFYEEALDECNRSSLHYAATCAQLNCCEVLLDSCLQLQADQRDDNNQTPFMCAAASIYPEAANVVRLLGMRLVKNGKQSLLTARDKNGRTALHLAVLTSNNPVIEVLLNELQCQSETFDNEGRTPLHYAAHRGLLEVTKMLLDAKARNVTRDIFGVTPAHYAAAEGHREILDLLLRRPNPQEVYDKDRRSCLVWAIVKRQVETVKYLLENFNYDSNDRDKYGYTAVHHAAHVGSTEIIKTLFKCRNRYDINSIDNNRATPLHIAAGRGLTDVVRYLITLGAVRESEDFLNRTPMFYACFGGQAYTLKVMLNELQCNGQSVDAYGRTPLHCAAFAGFAACIEVLLDTQEYPIYAEDNDQLTALHIASLYGKLDCVKALLQYGAAVNAHSTAGDVTPLDCAILNGHRRIHDYLRANDGVTATELKDMAARIIQRWWRSKRSRQRFHRYQDPSPPRKSLRHQRIFQM